jgi:predicted nucleic acid-binding protein
LKPKVRLSSPTVESRNTASYQWCSQSHASARWAKITWSDCVAINRVRFPRRWPGPCETKTVATAENTYVDPSALLTLYLHQPQSRMMNSWRSRSAAPITITHHGRVEIINGICLAAFRKAITAAAMMDALESFDEDLESSACVQADLLWWATLKRASELSRRHTPTFGCRSLDVLHVASALELGFGNFLTFDRRQQNLATAAGLKPIRLR